MISWIVAGALRSDYSPVSDAISDLAAVGSPTRSLMTAGFVCFGTAVPVYAARLRQAFPGGVWVAATASGLFTLGVAAVPLGRSSAWDALHGVLAGSGYVALALTPVLAAGALRAQGRHRAAAASLMVGASAGLFLAATVLGPAHGALQRIGLTLVDVWIVATAAHR